MCLSTCTYMAACVRVCFEASRADNQSNVHRTSRGQAHGAKGETLLSARRHQPVATRGCSKTVLWLFDLFGCSVKGDTRSHDLGCFIPGQFLAARFFFLVKDWMLVFILSLCPNFLKLACEIGCVFAICESGIESRMKKRRCSSWPYCHYLLKDTRVDSVSMEWYRRRWHCKCQ